MNTQRFLVSNTALPAQKIGSWTNRITFLIHQNPEFFDYILSPTAQENNQFRFCQKRSFLKLPSILKSWQLKNRIAKDYIKNIEELAKPDHKIQILVMDDTLLLEAISSFKKGSQLSIELVFSFHGHDLRLNPDLIQNTDKILFLTNLAYRKALELHEIFTPQVFIVGNGVRSDVFFPLSLKEKKEQKIKLGYQAEDEILIWMSNNRPKKGLQLFLKIIQEILSQHPHYKVMVIGVEKEDSISDPNIEFLGKIPNNELPQYLQIGDIYFFTSLWKEGFGLSMVEAAKSGNKVIASENGGIPEVVEDFDQAYLVKDPNKIENWVKAFQLATQNKSYIPDPKKLSDFHALSDWLTKYQNALMS